MSAQLSIPTDLSDDYASARFYERALAVDLAELQKLLGESAFYAWLNAAELDVLIERFGDGSMFAIDTLDPYDWYVFLTEVWKPSGLFAAANRVQNALLDELGL